MLISLQGIELMCAGFVISTVTDDSNNKTNYDCRKRYFTDGTAFNMSALTDDINEAFLWPRKEYSTCEGICDYLIDHDSLLIKRVLIGELQAMIEPVFDTAINADNPESVATDMTAVFLDTERLQDYVTYERKRMKNIKILQKPRMTIPLLP